VDSFDISGIPFAFLLGVLDMKTINQSETAFFLDQVIPVSQLGPKALSIYTLKYFIFDSTDSYRIKTARISMALMEIAFIDRPHVSD